MGSSVGWPCSPAGSAVGWPCSPAGSAVGWPCSPAGSAVGSWVTSLDLGPGVSVRTGAAVGRGVDCSAGAGSTVGVGWGVGLGDGVASVVALSCGVSVGPPWQAVAADASRTTRMMNTALMTTRSSPWAASVRPE